MAVFELEEVERPLYDVYLTERAGRLLANRATVLAGELLGPLAPPEPMPWITLTPEQRELFAAPAADRRPWAARIPGADGLARPRLEGPILR